MPSFSEAFAKARKEGKKTFEWNGKSYSTQLKGEGNNKGGYRDNKPKFRSRNDEMVAEQESKPKKPIAKKRGPETGRFSEPKQKSLEQHSDNTRVAKQPIEQRRKYEGEKPKGFLEETWDNITNFLDKNRPGIFVGRPFRGSEEDARKVGYRTRVDESGNVVPVTYPVASKDSVYHTNPITGERTLDRTQIARGQMERYGITEEQTRNKGYITRKAYEYSTPYGYNIDQTIENAIRGNRVMDPETMLPTGNKNETPVSDKIRETIFDVAGMLGKDIHLEQYKPVPSKTRADLRNLYFGYPTQYGTIEVTDQTPSKGQFEQGYGFRFKDKNPFYNPEFNSLQSGEHRQIKDGYNMGAHGISKSDDGSYVAYYDKWDINPLTPIPGLREIMPGNMDFLGTPFELYDRKPIKKKKKK